MNHRIKEIYDRLPPIFQNLALTAYSIKLDKQRYGGRFQEYRNSFEKSQWFSREQLLEDQNDRFMMLVKYALENVPYYQKKFSEYGLTLDSIKTIEDISKLPLLTKKDIVDNFNDLISTKVAKKNISFGHTSGTTGSPLEIAYSPEVLYATYAILDRQYKWANANLARLGDRVAVIRGNIIVPLADKKPPFWRYNYYHRQLLLSSFHLKSEYLEYYIAELIKFNPVVLDGYPSTLYVLAKYLENTDQTLPLQAVLSSSETLFDFQRELIESRFQCRVFDYFGAAERVMFATECGQHSGHHISTEYGVTEILDDSSQPVQQGVLGKIVATSLHNYAMPMIRYVTNDMTALKSQECACGRKLPLMEDVTTKAEDLLTMADGRLISPSVLTHPFKPMNCIESSQIIQENMGEIIIKIVPYDNYEEKKGEKLIADLQDRIGKDVKIKIELVEKLERTRSGKFKWVISKVKLGI